MLIIYLVSNLKIFPISDAEQTTILRIKFTIKIMLRIIYKSKRKNQWEYSEYPRIFQMIMKGTSML